MNYEDLIGKWMRDLDYEKNNNPIPLWAKDPWDCRLLICDTKMVEHHTYGRSLTIKIMFGFGVRKYLVEGNKFVASNVPAKKFGYLPGVIIKDGEVWAYNGEKRKGILLDDKPDIDLFLGQGSLL